MKTIAAVAALAVAHLSLTVALVAVSFAGTMASMDTGAPTGVFTRACRIASDTLAFPLVEPIATALPHAWVDGVLGWAWLLANSMLWALVIVLGTHRMSRHRSSARANAVATGSSSPSGTYAAYRTPTYIGASDAGRARTARCRSPSAASTMLDANVFSRKTRTITHALTMTSPLAITTGDGCRSSHVS